MGPVRSSVSAAAWPLVGRRLIATALGWIVAVIASLPVAVTAAGIALLSGASGAQIVGSGPVGVAVVILGVHLPAGLVAAVSMPAAWRRIVGETTTFGRAVRVTLPTMVAVAGLEAVKAVLPAIGYLSVTVLQLALALVPFTMRGLPGAIAAAPRAERRPSHHSTYRRRPRLDALRAESFRGRAPAWTAARRGHDGGVTRADNRLGLRSVLTRPGYRRLWAARTVSQCGDVVQFTTLSLLVLRLTGSGLGVSGAVLAEIAPVLLLAPVAGPLVDRLPRVPVMVAADVARLVLAAVLAVRHSDVAVVYAVAFGLSAGSVFFNPAAGSLLPTLVAEDELVAANSAIWSAAVLSQILLAPLAGLLAVTAGFGWAFAVNAVSFGASALILRGLRATEAARPVVSASIWVQGREALGVLGRDRLLRALAVGQALAALSAGATSALLVVLAARRLHTSGGGYGLMLATIGVGAFCGPLLLARASALVRRPRVVFAAFGLRGLVDVTLASVTALPAAMAALVCYGLGTSTGNVTFSAVIQSQVPEQLRGRVFSAFDLIWQAMRLASLLLGGVLADAFGIRAVFYTGGVLLLAAALAGVTASVSPATVPAPPDPT